MTTVSVIIPNFNHTRFLAGALNSVFAQTRRPDEVIVVDDGSTDGCDAVVARYGPAVRYIRQANQGLAAARNTGLRAATGEIVGLLDADDEWLPTYLATMLALAAQQPAAVFYCQALCMDEAGHDLPQVLGGPAVPPASVYWTLLRANFLIPSTILLRREPVVHAGLFDSALRSCEDWDLWLRLLPDHAAVGTAACLVRYRQHAASLSHNVQGMQHAAQAVITKNFGADDSRPANWPATKRRAYGGLYAFFVRTCVLRAGDWTAAATHLQQALQVDPSLAADLDLFYDLALGSQPPGYRGTAQQLDLTGNAQHLAGLLDTVFSGRSPALEPLRRQVLGTAYLALGLVAYNTGQRPASRHYLWQALAYRPDLWRNRLILGDLVKSFVSRSLLERIR